MRPMSIHTGIDRVLVRDDAIHDQIRTVRSLPPDTRNSPACSKTTHCTASSWPTSEAHCNDMVINKLRQINSRKNTNIAFSTGRLILTKTTSNGEREHQRALVKPFYHLMFPCLKASISPTIPSLHCNPPTQAHLLSMSRWTKQKHQELF